MENVIMRDKFGRFVKGNTEREGWKPTKKTREKIRQTLRRGEHVRCQQCSKEFFVSPSTTKKGEGKFCSKKCCGGFNRKEKTRHSYGYVLIYKPKHPHRDIRGQMREHRLVIEKQIGRYLLSKEEVHHFGKKDDNRPENLMAFVSKSAHRRFEMGGIVIQREIIFDGRKLKRRKKS